MSAGTSGILPSATYAAADGANSVVGADPLWLSTNGGAINGNVSLTGSLTVSNMITTAMLNGAFAGQVAPVAPDGTLGMAAVWSMVIGRTRICWGLTGPFNAESRTKSLLFSGIPAGSLPLQSTTGVFNKVGGTGVQFAICIAQDGLATGGIQGVFPNQAPSGTPSLGNVTFQEGNADVVSAMFLVVGEWEGAP